MEDNPTHPESDNVERVNVRRIAKYLIGLLLASFTRI
jgi:hypothetical protein